MLRSLLRSLSRPADLSSKISRFLPLISCPQLNVRFVLVGPQGMIFEKAAAICGCAQGQRAPVSPNCLAIEDDFRATRSRKLF